MNFQFVIDVLCAGALFIVVNFFRDVPHPAPARLLDCPHYTSIQHLLHILPQRMIIDELAASFFPLLLLLHLLLFALALLVHALI